MRLICPNCDAQYEVPDEVIPPGGRDVQCSECSHTWFFKPISSEELEDLQSESATADPAPAPPETATEEEPETEPKPQPEPETQPDGEPETDHQEADTLVQPRQREIDPAIAKVLREEAELEQQAREAERETLETQPDLGLGESDHREEASRRAAEARARMARMRGETGETAPEPAPADSAARAAAGAVAAAAAAEGTRRGLLPDVEEINSTLVADEDRASQQETEAPHRETPKAGKGGFRRGFIWVIALAAIAFCLYVFAPQISETLPPIAGVLGQYVEMVDLGRAWLDDQILSLMNATRAESTDG